MRPVVSFHSAGDIYCREVQMNEELSMAEHTHANAHIVLILNGFATSTWRKQSFVNGKGTLFYLPPEEPHQNSFSKDYRSLDLWMRPQWLPRLISDNVLEPLNIDGGPALTTMHQVLHEVRNFDEFTSIAMEALAIEAVCTIADVKSIREPKSPRWLSQARDLIHETLDTNVTLESIASAVGIHPAHLAKVFRSRYGMNIAEYVRRLRVQRARVMLEKTRKPLGMIAAELGFSDHSHFTRTFKREAGVSPQAYRSSL